MISNTEPIQEEYEHAYAELKRYLNVDEKELKYNAKLTALKFEDRNQKVSDYVLVELVDAETHEVKLVWRKKQ